MTAILTDQFPSGGTTSSTSLPPESSLILKRLRAETADSHAELETGLPLLEPNLSRETYRRLLMRFRGFYSPLEARLLDSPLDAVQGFNYRARLKAPKLACDLLGLGESATTLLQAPQCEDLPPLRTLPQALGCLYVIEGASLGGQIILRHLQSSLGLKPESGASFFHGYGTDTGARWKATRVFLTETAAHLGQDDAIVASANATFQSLGRWLAAGPSSR